MPIYEFRCQDCGEKFSVMVSISEKDKVACPACQSTNIKQLVSNCSYIGSACSSGKTRFGGG